MIPILCRTTGAPIYSTGHLAAKLNLQSNPMGWLWRSCWAQSQTECKAFVLLAQLTLSEKQTNPQSVLSAAFIPWEQSCYVFTAILLGFIPGFICMLGMISPMVLLCHAVESSAKQNWCIPKSSKHILKEHIFCLWVLPDGIQWLVGLIYEASWRKKLLDLTKGSSPPFWSFPSQTSNYSSWTPAAALSPLLLY